MELVRGLQGRFVELIGDNGQELLDVRSHDLFVLGETKGPLRVGRDGEDGVDVTEAGMQARTQAQRAVRT